MEMRVQVLSDDERAQVHERTLAVLERVGVRCDTDEGRRILAEAGAHVDEQTRVVRFPPELVERSPAAAGRRFWLDDVLERVGPSGSFLGERSTRVNARTGEWLLSDFGLYGGHDAWRAAGSPTTLDYAHRKVGEVLEAHRPLPFDDDVAATLADLQQRAAVAT